MLKQKKGVCVHSKVARITCHEHTAHRHHAHLAFQLLVRDPSELPECNPFPELEPLSAVQPPDECRLPVRGGARCVVFDGHFENGDPVADFTITQHRYTSITARDVFTLDLYLSSTYMYVYMHVYIYTPPSAWQCRVWIVIFTMKAWSDSMCMENGTSMWK